MEVEDLLVASLREAFKDYMLGLILFGSRARGDHRDESDYDLLLILERYFADDPVKTHFKAYESLRAFREAVGRDTTILVVSIRDLAKSVSSSLILNALFEGRVIYDRDGLVKKVKEKVCGKLRSLGVRRVKEDWGYTWIVTSNIVPFRVEVDIEDPLEYEYRLRLAEEHLEEAVKALGGGAVVAAAYEAQLSIENSAKAVIAFFKPPTWMHNPALELRQIIRQHEYLLRRVESLLGKLSELATMSEEVAPHHALASYGDIGRMKTPREIYGFKEAEGLIEKARRALGIARESIEFLKRQPREASTPI